MSNSSSNPELESIVDDFVRGLKPEESEHYLMRIRHYIVGTFIHESYRKYDEGISLNRHIHDMTGSIETIAYKVQLFIDFKDRDKRFIPFERVKRFCPSYGSDSLKNIWFRIEHKLIATMLKRMIFSKLPHENEIWYEDRLSIWNIRQSTVDAYNKTIAPLNARTRAENDDRAYHGSDKIGTSTKTLVSPAA